MAEIDDTAARAAPATPGVSDDPQVVRAEIEQTRERMSETIDEIEEALARKKEQIQERLDVLAPIRQRPLQSAGIAFGVGLLLGVVTGGGDSDDDSSRERPHESHGRSRAMSIAGMGLSRGHRDEENWEERARMWESRARRLLSVAREQEEAIRELQERYGTLYSHDMEHHHQGFSREDEETVGALRSTVTGLRDDVLGGITELLTDAFHQMGQERGGRATA
ncbi:MAG TPA: DUF3618 domain-containing protein [Longimicrobiaceae bacterium]